MNFLQYWASRFDHKIYYFMQRIHRDWLDPFLSWPTHLGDIGWLLILLAAGILIFDRAKGTKRALAIVPLVYLEHLFMIFMKAFFSRPRPFDFWEDVIVLGHRPRNNSFPSGHMSDVTAAAFLLNTFYPGSGKWAYPLAFLVGMTRIYRGVHYPTDIIGGAALGIGFAAFSIVLLSALKILPKIAPTPGPSRKNRN